MLALKQMCAALFKPQITPNFIIRTLHLKTVAVPRPNQPFTQIITDSREAKPGCLFIALKGEKVDGHEFIQHAIANGARGVISKRNLFHFHSKDVWFFPVEDPLIAYRKLAAAWRREFSLPLAVIAGSSGKTTTKELLAALLQGKWPSLLKTSKSQNGFIGIPKTLLELKLEHEAAIIEVGIDEPGTMQQHMELIAPNASLLTSIGAEHLQQLQDLPTVAREEGIALSYVAKTGGIVCINLDDPWIRPHFSTLREGRKIPYSLQGTKVSTDMILGEVHLEKQQLTFWGLGLERTSVPLPLPGQHNASNLLAAITLAAGWGLSSAEIQEGLKKFRGTEGRSEIRQFPNGTQVINDSYNANPSSVEAALTLLAQLADQKRMQSSWLCLGDMLELGRLEEQFHRKLADSIIRFNIQNVLLYGSRMEALLDELKQRDFKGHSAHFMSHADMATALLQGLHAGDVVLIKGSRGMRMEEVWKLIHHEFNPQHSESFLRTEGTHS